MNQKLCSFLNTTLQAGLPNDFKLYERCGDERQGVYKFKFQVVEEKDADATLEKRYTSYDKERLIEEFLGLTNKWHVTKDSGLFERANAAAKVLLEKDWMTEEKIRGHIYLQ